MNILEKLVNNQLTYDDMREVMEEIMLGKIDDITIGAFLTGLRVKGERIEELKAMYDAMLKHAITIRLDVDAIDTCGTGGDKIKTFNISTAAALVASTSTYVAKHGNRSVTSYSGSADILESLGYNLFLEPDKVRESIEQLGFGFLFAPVFHPSMKHVAKARKAIGIRTAFNILGPIANPCDIKAQIVGVGSLDLMEKVAKLLIAIGREEAMVFHALDGLDELSTCMNKILWIRDKKIEELVINPKSFSLSSNISDITVKSKEEAIKSFLKALNGYDRAKSDIVALNTSAALIVSKKVLSFSEGIEEARESIYSGRAYEQLRALIKRYGDYSKLEELEDAFLKKAG